MYASFLNQIINFSKFLGAFIFLFIIAPAFIFPKSDDSKIDSLVSGYVKMVFLLIIVGYVLVITKLFEFFSIFIVLLTLAVAKKIHESGLFSTKPKGRALYFVLDILERGGFRGKISKVVRVFWEESIVPIFQYFRSFKNVVFVLLFILSILGWGYLRFFDAFTHAAPPLSDAYTTLLWMKKVESRILFFDNGGGIYPRGLSIYMASIHKFAFIDEIYVLKYAGPLNSLFICLGIYLFVARCTGKRYAGLIASSLLGFIAAQFGTSIERFASTNSQEFAFVFFLPMLYYFYKYLRGKRRQDLFTAFAAVSIMGLVHSFVFGFALMAAALLAFYAVLVSWKGYIRETLFAALVCTASVLIALLPLLYGKLTGASLHGSSAEFLTDTSTYELRTLTVVDYVVIASLFLMLIRGLYLNKKYWKELNPYTFSAFIGTAMFLIDFAGGYITRSTLLSSRTPDMWAVFSTVCVGMGASVILIIIRSKKADEIVGAMTYVIVVALLLSKFGLAPITPYKMEWDAGIEQYLKIHSIYGTKEWIMVAQDEQFSIVYGNGFHILTDAFLKDYPPESFGSSKWSNLSNDIFIYLPIHLFEVSKSSGIYSVEKPIYERRELEKQELQKWLYTFKALGNKYDVFYQDKNLRIIHIKNTTVPRNDTDKIWGG